MEKIEMESIQLFLLGDAALVCATYGLDTLALVSCFAGAACEGKVHWLLSVFSMPVVLFDISAFARWKHFIPLSLDSVYLVCRHHV